MNKIFMLALIFFLIILPLILGIIFSLNFAEIVIISIGIFIIFWIILEIVFALISLYILIGIYIRNRKDT